MRPTSRRTHAFRLSGRRLISVLGDSKEQSEAFMQNALVSALSADGGFAGYPTERTAQVAHHETS